MANYILTSGKNSKELFKAGTLRLWLVLLASVIGTGCGMDEKPEVTRRAPQTNEKSAGNAAKKNPPLGTDKPNENQGGNSGNGPAPGNPKPGTGGTGGTGGDEPGNGAGGSPTNTIDIMVWVPASGTALPYNAISFGSVDTSKGFVCRMQEGENVITGYFIQGEGCTVFVNGAPQKPTEFEILGLRPGQKLTLEEVQSTVASIPDDAMVVGKLNGAPLYLCRVDNASGTISFGQVSSVSQGCTVWGLGTEKLHETFWIIRRTNI